MKIKTNTLKERIIDYIEKNNKLTEEKIEDGYDLSIPLLKDWSNLTLNANISKRKEKIKYGTSIIGDVNIEILDSRNITYENKVSVKDLKEKIAKDFIYYIEHIPSYRVKSFKNKFDKNDDLKDEV